MDMAARKTEGRKEGNIYVSSTKPSGENEAACRNSPAPPSPPTLPSIRKQWQRSIVGDDEGRSVVIGKWKEKEVVCCCEMQMV